MQPALNGWCLALALVAVFSSCQEKQKPTLAVVPAENPSTKPYVYPNAQKQVERAEVELFGSWLAGDVKVSSARFQVQVEPCMPVIEKPTVFGARTMSAPGPIAEEYFIAQGAIGHVCLFGFDAAGKLNSVASLDRNPMTFQGTGEVIVQDMKLTLQAL